ncbi:hypothetical protein LTS15_009623 [Exophiala xenobiotica]|nr:hypothetical protein LTS15_009623 [Exophiala xenobiotica]
MTVVEDRLPHKKDSPLLGLASLQAPSTIYRLIGANVLIGVGFASVPMAYAVPSEILPRRWRPLAQAGVNIAAILATIAGPFTNGALTKRNTHTGWRSFYWFQAALWGATTIALCVGYRPPTRHTRLDHLSFWGKLGHIDPIGCFLLTAGLTLFIGTKTGILHHDLFHGGRNKGRTFAIGLIGLATIQPGQSASAIAFSCLTGIGVGAPLIPVVTDVQLSTPYSLIATATACTTSSRAVAGAVFSAIYAAAFNTRLKDYLPKYIAKAALASGLSASSLPAFTLALSEGDSPVALAKIPGISPTIVAQGARALQQAFADSIRVGSGRHSEWSPVSPAGSWVT